MSPLEGTTPLGQVRAEDHGRRPVKKKRKKEKKKNKYNKVKGENIGTWSARGAVGEHGGTKEEYEKQ